MKQTKHKRRRRYLRQRILYLRGRGLSNKEIALKLGIGERTVYRIARDVNQNFVVFFSEGKGFINRSDSEFCC